MKFADLVAQLAAAADADQAAEMADRAAEIAADLEAAAPPVVVATAEEAIALAHELFPGRGPATKWLEDAAGLKDRTARRWLQEGATPHERIPRLITLVEQEAERRRREELGAAIAGAVAAAKAAAEAAAGGTGRKAAAQLAALAPTGVSVGSVSVEYDGADEGERHINEVDIDWGEIVDALEDEDLDGAEEAFSAAVLNAYEGGDLGAVLTIANYDHIDPR